MVRQAALLTTVTFALALTTAAPTAETGFLNRTLEFGGETYRYQVYVPADYTPARRWPIVLFLHGGGEHGVDGLLQTEVGLGSAIRRHADRYPGIVVFPQTRPNAPWAGAMAEVAIRALEKTEAEFAVDPERVYLTGLSRGGAGTWYLAYRHPDRFAALVVVCGRVRPSPTTTDPVVPPNDGEPFVTLAAKIQRVPTWIFHGDADQTVPVDESRGMATALEALKAPVRYSELPGVGHNSWDAAYRSAEMPEWLFAQQRRRP